MEILKTEVARYGKDVYGVFTVKSSSGKEYRVDMTNGRCDCPAWKFSRKTADGRRPLCKHLLSLGYKEPEITPPAYVPPVKMTTLSKEL